MQEPTAADLDKVKSDFPNREVMPFCLSDSFGEYWFILTSPNGAEWTKYLQEIKTAGGDVELLNKAVTRLAIAETRYPERQEILNLFERRPGLAQQFASPLGEMAGLDAEGHLKK